MDDVHVVYLHCNCQSSK